MRPVNYWSVHEFIKYHAEQERLKKERAIRVWQRHWRTRLAARLRQWADRIAIPPPEGFEEE